MASLLSDRRERQLLNFLTSFAHKVLAKASGKAERMDKLSIVCVYLSTFLSLLLTI